MNRSISALSVVAMRLAASVAIAASGSMAIAPGAIAQNTNFVCGAWQGKPTTIAQTASGDVPVIVWVSDYFADSGYTPQKRCEIVSAKFQEFFQQGTLKYLTTGRKNGQNIVCVAQAENAPCSGQLFTLKPDSNPGATLQQLLQVRVRASGPLNESNTRVYINMDEYLQEARAELEKEAADSNSTSPVITPDQEVNPLF